MHPMIVDGADRLERARLVGTTLARLHEAYRQLHYSRPLYEMRREAFRRRPGHPPPLGLRVAFVPQPVRPMHTAYQLCVRLDVPIVPERAADVVIYWHDTTLRDDPPPNLDPKAVNGRVRDIGKRHVHELHAQVFGYGLEPEPGAPVIVEKSNTNSRHDGRIRARPSGDPGLVVERLVDTNLSPSVTLEYRVVVMNRRIVQAYARLRPAWDRFRARNYFATLIRPDDVFSRIEQDRLVAFADAGGADYADLDVLRDRASGRLYAVDLNSTPAGPPTRLLRHDRPAYWHSLEEGWRELLAAHARPG